MNEASESSESRFPLGDWPSALMRAYVRHSARRLFFAWHVAAAEPEALRDGSLPLLCLPNHTSWWDGFFAALLAAHWQRRFGVLMQADQLARYPFFRWGGALPLDRRHPRRAYDALRRAAASLRGGDWLWLFPQGRRTPSGAPLCLEGGAARLALWAAPVRVVPVALRYTFLSEERPEAFAWFGPSFVVEPGTPRALVQARIEASLEEALATLDARLARTERAGFETLLAGRGSVNTRLSTWWSRLTGAPTPPLPNG